MPLVCLLWTALSCRRCRPIAYQLKLCKPFWFDLINKREDTIQVGAKLWSGVQVALVMKVCRAEHTEKHLRYLCSSAMTRLPRLYFDEGVNFALACALIQHLRISNRPIDTMSALSAPGTNSATSRNSNSTKRIKRRQICTLPGHQCVAKLRSTQRSSIHILQAKEQVSLL